MGSIRDQTHIDTAFHAVTERRQLGFLQPYQRLQERYALRRQGRHVQRVRGAGGHAVHKR